MDLSEPEVVQSLMKWRTRLSAAAWLVTQDVHAAEDIFQNVVLKAMTREVSFENESVLLSWAFITARREALDWVRHRQREKLGLEPEILELLEQEWQTAVAPASGEKIDALRVCLASTPVSSQRLLKLRYWYGFSCEEVAERMGIGLEAVYKRLSRLHQGLKTCVEDKIRPLARAPQ